MKACFIYRILFVETRAISEDNNSDVNIEIKDPVEMIKESHEEAVQKSCHCPIGSCLHRSEELSSPPEDTTKT